MNRYLFSLIILCSLMTACRDAEKKDDAKTEKETAPKEEFPDMDGGELLNVYADSLSIVADSLDELYNHLISEAAQKRNQLDSIKASNKEKAVYLENRMNELTLKMDALRESGRVSEEEYEEIFLSIDLQSFSKNAEELRLLGIDYKD